MLNKVLTTLLIVFVCAGVSRTGKLQAGLVSTSNTQPAINYATRAQEQLQALEKILEQFKGKLNERDMIDVAVEKAYVQGITDHDSHALDFAYIPGKGGRALTAIFPVKLACLRRNLEQMGYGPGVDMQIDYSQFYCQESYSGLRNCKVTFTLNGNSTSRESFTKSFYCEAKFECTTEKNNILASTTSGEILGSLYMMDGHGSSQQEILMDMLHSITGSVLKAKVVKLQCF